MSLLTAGGLELGDLQHPFRPSPFYNSVILWFHDKWPPQNFRLSFSCADAEARNEQRTCSTCSPIKVFVYGKVSLFSKTNICFHLLLKSQGRANIAVPQCLQAQSMVKMSVKSQDAAGVQFCVATLVQSLWKQILMNGVLFISPFSCPYFTGRFFSHLVSLKLFLALWFPSKYDLWKLFTSSHLQAVKCMAGSGENRKFQCNSQRWCVGLKPKSVLCLFWLT